MDKSLGTTPLKTMTGADGDQDADQPHQIGPGQSQQNQNSRILAPRPRDDGPTSNPINAGAAGTPGFSKKRPPVNPRGVATMTPERLARKRANDREAQRAVRERTKAQIRGLQDEVLVLKGDQAQLQQVLQENSALQAENVAIRQAMAHLVQQLDSQSLTAQPGTAQHQSDTHKHQHQPHASPSLSAHSPALAGFNMPSGHHTSDRGSPRPPANSSPVLGQSHGPALATPPSSVLRSYTASQPTAGSSGYDSSSGARQGSYGAATSASPIHPNESVSRRGGSVSSGSGGGTGFRSPYSSLVLPGIAEFTRGTLANGTMRESSARDTENSSGDSEDSSTRYSRQTHALYKQRDQMVLDMGPSTANNEQVNLQFVAGSHEPSAFPLAVGHGVPSSPSGYLSRPNHMTQVPSTSNTSIGSNGEPPPPPSYDHHRPGHRHTGSGHIHQQHPPHRRSNPGTSSPRAFVSTVRPGFGDLATVTPPLSAFATPSAPMRHALSAINVATYLNEAPVDQSAASACGSSGQFSGGQNMSSTRSSSGSINNNGGGGNRAPDLAGGTQVSDMADGLVAGGERGNASSSSRAAGISNSNSSAEDVRMRDAGNSSDDASSSTDAKMTTDSGDIEDTGDIKNVSLGDVNKRAAGKSKGNISSSSDSAVDSAPDAGVNSLLTPAGSSVACSSRATPSIRHSHHSHNRSHGHLHTHGHGHGGFSHNRGRSRNVSSSRGYPSSGKHREADGDGATNEDECSPSPSPLVRLNIAHVPATCMIDELLLNLLSHHDTGHVNQPEIATLLIPATASYETLRDRLDPVSAVLSDIISSFGTFNRLPERVAVMYSSFLLMKYLANATADNYERVPSFLRPLEEQLSVPHAAWIDLFPFPHGRLRLINDQRMIQQSGMKGADSQRPESSSGRGMVAPGEMESFFALYLGCLSINWVYEDTDVLLLTPSNELIINPVFDRHLRRLENWTLSPRFLDKYSEFGRFLNIKPRTT